MTADSLSQARVLVLGDLILDEFVWGRVRRISPEAPVPVVEVERREFYLGGAANVARNLAGFAGRTGMIGRIGDDLPGGQLRELFDDQGIERPLGLADQGLPTIIKTRIVARQQQVARVDEERIEPLSAENRQSLIDYLQREADQWDALILQDYAKGFFDQDLIDLIVAVCDERLVIVADPNPRNPLTWRGCHTVKPNRSEAFAAAGIADPGHHPADPASDEIFLEVGERLINAWSPRHLLMTLGEQGMLLFDSLDPSRPVHVQAQASEVFDVSGAGDTAIGFYALALAGGRSASEATALANAASSRVVEKIGTAVLTPKEFDAIRQGG